MVSFSAIAQTGTVSGKVLDEDNGEPLIGANVRVKGTTKGSVADVGGNFKIGDVAVGSQTIVVSFIGFGEKEVEVTVNEGQNTDIGTVQMKSSAIGLSEVQVIASVAVDRKTPVAVSTIKESFIAEKASNQEFPELLKSTPGVYATKTGGGYGDSRINVRGFNSVNVAVLINGVPVNDMENGRVYWSNWAGLTDVTRSMQVQRGLGASKVAVPSIGGTINILTHTTDAEKGGYVFAGVGNNNYKKAAFSLSSGLTEKNWAVSVAAAKITGDGWAEGLEFEGYNYFFNVSKIINDEHTLSLTGFGAPQRHGQRQNMQSIETFRNAPQGIKYNADWGILNGEVVHVEDNFYHKPQFSLNHYWTINETSELSTALYASYGTGGGGGYQNVDISIGDFRTGNEYSPYDLDAVVDQNVASADGHALSFLRASRNDHKWYGALSTYTKEVNSNLDILAGLDLRYYKGIHFTEVVDLLGADYVLDDSDANQPVRRAGVGDKINYYNDGIVLWEGGFLQAEYTSGALTAFASLAASNTSYKRIDYFLYEDDDPLQETDFQNFFGYQVKGGANYNLTRNHNVFANLGYFEKAPDFDAVYQNNQNIVNEDAENQKILSFELGYGYRSTQLNANVNFYRTNWKDRTFTQRFPGSDNQFFFANILGVNALHQGVELDFLYKPTTNLTFNGMLSVGDWVWQNNVDGVNIFDENQDIVGSISTLYIEDLKVGDAAQTTAAFGIDYKVIDNFKLGMTYNYYANLYASYDPTDRTDETVVGKQAWEVPDYSLVDVNAAVDFNIGNLKAVLYANVNNLFDVEYISDAQDGDYDGDGIGDAAGARVFYGFGRTWTTGLKIKF
ncbi:TonB-dependent receptor [Fulvivirga kasyanovii]